MRVCMNTPIHGHTFVFINEAEMYTHSMEGSRLQNRTLYTARVVVMRRVVAAREVPVAARHAAAAHALCRRERRARRQAHWNKRHVINSLPVRIVRVLGQEH